MLSANDSGQLLQNKTVAGTLPRHTDRSETKVGDRYDWTTPGHRTMEMNGKSTVSYLVRTPRVPFLMLILLGLKAKNLLAFQGRRGIASAVRWNLRPVIFGVDKG